MRNFFTRFGIGFIILAAGFATILCLYYYDKEVKSEAKSEAITIIKTEIKQKMEFAYFEGQKDYANGDIRIVKNECVWYWSKSPWDGQDTSRTIFKPENERVEQ